jgi:transcriptional regulator with XRE-family HTH domain
VSDFGEAVRSAREARGWTQAELAVRVGVSQRAVSSWEKGVSEPPEATKTAVAEVLPLPSAVASRAGTGLRRSGTPLLAELPLEDLDPGEFENFAVTLAGDLYPGAEASRAGTSGHKQYGFDVVVEQNGEVLAGIQCKRVRQFGPQEVRKAVAAAEMNVGTALIFLSRPASPDALAAMRAHPGWRLWDKNKLSHKVHELPLDRSARLVDRYFPLLREQFLGVPPGPWLEPAQYFTRTGRSERASHSWPLAGRAGMLDELVRFGAGPPGRVGILAGRGGMGKTKMLHALCDQLLPPDVTVRFLERDPVIDHRAFEQLPAGRLLLVVDDAHDEDTPVGKVVAGVLATNPVASIMLAVRPDGERRLRRQLREAGVDLEQVPRWELADLDMADAELLAREVLGPQHAHAAGRLAAVARDCPFLLVTGAIMVRDGTVKLHRLEGDDRLRRELVELAGETVSPGGTDQPEVREEVLHAVAALQPLRTEDGAFQEALTELTGRAFDQILPHLSAWEDAGVLLRRGQTYRIWPDLLGDALLARASTAKDTGTPTGYLDRVRRVARGDALANLIVNAGRIDWQEPPARRGRSVASLWHLVTAEFEAADAAVRAAMLGVLAKVAFYQPKPVLAMVRWALEHPADPVTEDAGLGLSYTYTDQDVRDAAAPVLRTAAYDAETLSDAADLLWELARSDARQPSQHPNHALRMLSDLARFDHRGVTISQQSMPAIVERWLHHPRRDNDVHDPLTVLHPLLAADGHHEIWHAHALTFRPFLINPDAPFVADLRSRVLDLAFEQLTSPDLRRAVAAVQTTGAALTGPRGGFGLEITDERRAPWTNQFNQTLNRLSDAILTHPPTPVVAVAVRDQLQWHAEHPASPLHQASRDVLATLPRSPDHELARAMHGGPADPPSDPLASQDYLDRHRAIQESLAACADTIATWPEHRAVPVIAQLLGDLRRALGDDDGRPRPFVSLLVTVCPRLGEALCTRARHAPDEPLASLVSAILSALARAGNSGAVKLAYQLVDSKDLGLARQVAHAFGLQRGRTSLLDGEDALLLALVRHPDPEGIVSAAALGAVRYITAEHRDLSIELLTSALEDHIARPALREFAMAFGPNGQLAWKDLAQRHKDGYLDALRTTESIGSFEITGFLSMLSLQDPQPVINLLTGRIEIVEAGARLSSYTALPYSWPVALRFRDRDDFPDLLRRIREWLAEAPGSIWRHHLGSELFATVAGSFDAQARQVIEEYLTEPDKTKIRTVSTMLRGAPRALVWDADFVSRCLRAADQCGIESLTMVQNALHAAIFTGGRWADPGQPYSEDVEQRDTAAHLAAQAARGSVEENFYRTLSQSAEIWIDRSVSEDDIPTDGRDW